VDRYGQVIGVNTAVFGRSIQGVSVGETIKLAIPINIAKNILVDLKNGRNIVNTKIAKQEQAETAKPYTETDILNYNKWKIVMRNVSDSFKIVATNFIEGRNDFDSKSLNTAITKFTLCEESGGIAYKYAMELPIILSIPVTSEYRLNWLRLITVQRRVCQGYKIASKNFLVDDYTDGLDALRRLGEDDNARVELHGVTITQWEEIILKAEALGMDTN